MRASIIHSRSIIVITRSREIGIYPSRPNGEFTAAVIFIPSATEIRGITISTAVRSGVRQSEYVLNYLAVGNNVVIFVSAMAIVGRLKS